MDYGLTLVAFLLNLIGILLTPVYIFLEWLKKGDKVPPITDNLLLIPVTELAAKIRVQEVKSEEVVRAYIERIKLVEPIINAVVEDRFEAALKDARSADEMSTSTDRTELETKYPLLGVPFTVKESCGLQGFSQSAGSLTRKGRKAIFDGEVVTNLKSAGAIPLLVSANPEYCVSWETNNLLKGACRNPYNTRHSPGGSSGGEGALIAAGASPFGVGSDMAGSIRIPCAFNGIFGHKPTGGLLSTNGHFPGNTDPEFSTYLQTGPMCRYAVDLPMILEIMAGEKAKMKLENELHLKDIKVYTTSGYGRRAIGNCISPEIERVMQEGASYFRQIGMDVKEVKLSSNIDDSLEGSLAKFLEMNDIPDLLQHPDDPKMRDNLFVEFAKHLIGIPKYTLAALIFKVLKETGGFMTAASRKLHGEKLSILRKELLDLLGADGILIFPTIHCTAFTHHESYTNMPGVMYTMFFNVIGFPGTHIPLGLSKRGLPIGFQVVAAPYKDKLCLTVATELEKKFGGWIPPS
ncbi:unnamed protein product [Hermetia illucens]|uniref:Amidase domain-containing protein n=1 Tax=Hermetia illucens TaxID=343691 RepID=A0A7R8UR69_HERIL|nr:fatty-acid amide hydrolase 2-like [Hermetia illucens]XP_037909633.1 fatty-acid amide hydrolase 2-like [Hermetia illucens]XP_037909634.1 fatty-acid amide hydrolase 2-like [Hermetia illucens]CAD7085135.1 unnamed protein product [Hermetia illucens]